MIYHSFRQKDTHTTKIPLGSFTVLITSERKSADLSRIVSHIRVDMCEVRTALLASLAVPVASPRIYAASFSISLHLGPLVDCRGDQTLKQPALIHKRLQLATCPCNSQTLQLSSNILCLNARAQYLLGKRTLRGLFLKRPNLSASLLLQVV